MFDHTISGPARNEIQRVERHVAEHDDGLAIPRVTAEFLHALVLAGGFRRGIEIGTSYGYSALWIATAIEHNSGLLTTIDRDENKVRFAKDACLRAGLGQTVVCMEEDAREAIRAVDGPFDFVFLDAEKSQTRAYFDELWPKLAQRATIVTDNITSHADELADFVQYVRSHSNLCSTLVPIGSGLELTNKLDLFTGTSTLDGADWVI